MLEENYVQRRRFARDFSTHYCNGLNLLKEVAVSQFEQLSYSLQSISIENYSFFYYLSVLASNVPLFLVECSVIKSFDFFFQLKRFLSFYINRNTVFGPNSCFWISHFGLIFELLFRTFHLGGVLTLAAAWTSTVRSCIMILMFASSIFARLVCCCFVALYVRLSFRKFVWMWSGPGSGFFELVSSVFSWIFLEFLCNLTHLYRAIVWRLIMFKRLCLNALWW